MASTLNDIYKGDTKVYNLTFTKGGSALDLTDSSVWFTLKKTESNADTLAQIQKQITSHTDPKNGKTTITLTSTDTDIDVGRYFYDFQLVDSTNQVTTLVKDTLSILQDITRSDS